MTSNDSPGRQRPLAIAAMTTVSALGRGTAAALAALRRGRSGLRPCDFADADVPTFIGRVEGVEDEGLPAEFAQFDCRNNRLAHLALTQAEFARPLASARHAFGPGRIGVFVGTSTSGIRETEEAYARRGGGPLPPRFVYRGTQNIFSVADVTQRLLGLRGPALAISTACSSSAKVFASAYRAMAAGLCDAAVVGGVDSLCLTTLYGFRALELTSPERCRPWDAERQGLNIGEAAGFALLTWPRDGAEADVALLGFGESSDAHHMTAPHPQGEGAKQAMRAALARAGLTAEALDYVNLHGTGTPANDAAEDLAVTAVCGRSVPCGSTKGWTGHTLGAAGITEAIFGCLALRHGFLPACLNTRRRDPKLSANILLANEERPVSVVLSNSFGFGGTNCSLVLGRWP